MVKFKTILNFGVANKLITFERVSELDPWKRGKRVSIVAKYSGPKAKAARQSVLQQCHYEAVLEKIQVPAVKTFWMLAWNTGLRSQKVLDMTWDQIDIDERFIYLDLSDTYKKNPPRIYINDHLLEYLVSHPRAFNHNPGERLILKDNGEPYKDPSKTLKRAFKRAGIEYGRNGGLKSFTTHDMRRSMKQHSRKAGVDARVRDFMLGHSTEGYGMDDTYDPIDDEDLKDAIEKIIAWRQGHPDGNGNGLKIDAGGVRQSVRPKLKVIK